MVNKIIGEAKGIFNVITLFEITIALIYIIVGILLILLLVILLYQLLQDLY